jgi:hypothetical protein
MPTAQQRWLPSLDPQIIYASDFVGDKYHGPGSVSVQELPDLYSKAQLFYSPSSAENGWIEIPFKVEKKEPVRLLIMATQAPDYGIYQALLNGVKIGSKMDFYNKDIRSNEYHLLDFWPEPGDYTLRLECVGKNHFSEAAKCGIESVRLRQRQPRVLQYGHEKDKKWQEKPTLYN